YKVMEIDVSGINEIVKKFKSMPYKLEKARDRAMVRTKDSLITASSRAINKQYTIKQSDLKTSKKNGTKGLLSVRPYQNKSGLEIIFGGRVLTPVRFQHTPRTIPSLTPKGKRRKYVPTVTIFGGSTYRLKPQRGVDGKKHPVFLAPTGATIPGQIPRIFFYRTGGTNKKGQKGREIKPIRTVSVPQMLLNARVAPEIQQAAIDTFMKRFEHESKRILKGDF
ncbi:MAG: hypothetical protein RR444_09745, partial [Oscillospiraceae bacterium]